MISGTLSSVLTGAETIEKIARKIQENNSTFYIVKYLGSEVGAIRIVKLDEFEKIRVSPVFVLPQFQNKGIGQEIFKNIEKIYKPKKGWILETIKQEDQICRFYEKMGYNLTGKIEEIKPGMEIVFYEKGCPTTESPRVYRRPNSLRGYGYGKSK